jgi:hypothetical protein
MNSESSASQEEGPEQPLLSEQYKLSDHQPCAKFLLRSSSEGVWYRGEIYKNDKEQDGQTLKEKFLRITRMPRDNFSKFISYKFKYKLDSSITRTFCITFRQQPRRKNFVLGGFDNSFHIRLSLIEEIEEKSGDEPSKIKCQGSESLILEPKFFKKDGIEIPTKENAKFSSITSGQTEDQIAEVVGMDVYKKTPNKYKVFFDTHIFNYMQTLGGILVDHCKPSNDSPVSSSDGGATRKRKRLTRRRKSLVGRKGKKSYRKKKYGKTKKSRKFRRSVRSRR